MTDGWMHADRPDGRMLQVRQWHVGDPMVCSYGKSRYSGSCEPPAVVMRIEREKRGMLVYQACPRHFVTSFWPGGPPSPTTEAHRRARAELQERHRNEYQRLFEESLAVLIGECVAAIPEGLRHSLGPEVAQRIAQISG